MTFDPRISSLLALTLTVATGCKKDVTAAPAPASSATAVTAAGASPASDKGAGYSRSSTSCEGIRRGLTGGLSKETYVPGTWGTAPKALQVLPPGGELCGAGSSSKVPVVRSALFGDALGDFYKPIAATMGCKWGGVEINASGQYKTTHVKFTCPGGPSHVLIHTDSGTEFYYVGGY